MSVYTNFNNPWDDEVSGSGEDAGASLLLPPATLQSQTPLPLRRQSGRNQASYGSQYLFDTHPAESEGPTLAVPRTALSTARQATLQKVCALIESIGEGGKTNNNLGDPMQYATGFISSVSNGILDTMARMSNLRPTTIDFVSTAREAGPFLFVIHPCGGAVQCTAKEFEVANRLRAQLFEVTIDNPVETRQNAKLSTIELSVSCAFTVRHASPVLAQMCKLTKLFLDCSMYDLVRDYNHRPSRQTLAGTVALALACGSGLGFPSSLVGLYRG